jgi:prepilin-type N-terminal cleavage/methylation domain-containing protein
MRRHSGMTLIELLVVMLVLSILAGAIATVALQASREGPEKAARADIQLISLALDAYKLDHRTYPPDTGYGLERERPPATCDYDPGSLWRYLTKPVYDNRRKKMFGPYMDWDQDDMKPYDDGREDAEFLGESNYLTDPWGNPYGYVGHRTRVIHNHGAFDIFSPGVDGVTAVDNNEDDYLETPDNYKDVPSKNPLSTNRLDNRAYNGKDDDGNGFVDDVNEFGPEAIMNGDVGDDINNWSMD